MAKEYYIYVGQLSKEFVRSSKAKKKNNNINPKYDFGLYVGYSSKPPRERWDQHLKKAKSKKGIKIFSKVAAKWGENYIHWKKFQKYNPVKSISKAKALERKIAIKYRDKGYAVWSDKIPYLNE